MERDLPTPPANHVGVHDDCAICDAILVKRASDDDADFVDAGEVLA